MTYPAYIGLFVVALVLLEAFETVVLPRRVTRWFRPVSYTHLDVYKRQQLLRTERMKHDRLVDPVHEFRCEFALGRFGRGLFDFLVQTNAGVGLRFRCKTHSADHQFGDFLASQIRSEEDHGLRQIHAPVVAKRECGFVEYPQPVSYTHLDVYKRQPGSCSGCALGMR